MNTTAQALERLESDIRALADTAPPYEDRMFEWADQLSALRALYTHPQPAVVSDAQVEAFARVYWKGNWPFMPDTEANRELVAEFRDVIKRGLIAALTEGGSRE